MKSTFQKARDWLWFRLFGWGVVDAFKVLSRDVIGNRRRISELKSRMLDLERRVWELEDHSSRESLANAKRKVSEWSSMIKDLHGSEDSAPSEQEAKS